MSEPITTAKWDSLTFDSEQLDKLVAKIVASEFDDEQLDEIAAMIAGNETEITDWINRVRTVADLVERLLAICRPEEDAANESSVSALD